MAAFPMTASKPSALGLNDRALDRLQELITRHIAEGRYPGAQIALARKGQLALTASFGDARTEPKRAAATDDSLWLLYSNTKVITACGVWLLAEQSALSFTDTVAARRRAGRWWLRDGARDGGVLPDARAGRHAERRAAALAADRAICDAQLHGRAPRPQYGDADAPRPWPARAREHAGHSRPRLA